MPDESLSSAFDLQGSTCSHPGGISAAWFIMALFSEVIGSAVDVLKNGPWSVSVNDGMPPLLAGQ